MNIKNIIIIILCLWATCSFAQNIQGTIKSHTGEAVAFANIAVLNSSKGTKADENGDFTLALPNGTYTLLVSFTDYATQTKTVQIEKDKSTTINFILTKQSNQLDEVIVTSEKREEKLQQIPIAVSALSAQKLNDYRAWTIADLTALAPSLFVCEHGNSSGSNFFNIRGTMGFTNEQSVATYVDGVYQFDFYSAPINFNNIERIEILRGPQGTLYGRNAFSGVVNIITKNPTNAISGFTTIDFGNYEQQRYSMGFNIPILKDKLFFNMSAQYNKRGSIYSNPTLNTTNFDGRKDFDINGNLKYLISDKWQLIVNAKTENDNDKGAYPWSSSASDALNYPYQVFGNWDNTERRTNTNASATANYFGKHFNFTSITSGIDFHVWFPGRFDYDFTADDLISGSNATKSQQLTQEFRFNSPSNTDKLKWTAGSYLFTEKTKTNFITYYDEDYAVYDSSAPYNIITNGVKKNRGIAFFGQTTYNLTSKLDITAGTRYDIEKKERTESNDYEKDTIITSITATETDDKTFNSFTPKLILSYKITDNSLVYASYAKGFRVGGFNIGATSTNNISYDPEKSDNYEVAIKNSFFENKLKMNITAFYLQQKDQQVGTSTDGVNYLMLNVGDMNNLGLETEVSAIPFKNFVLDWNASYSHAEYSKLDLYDYTTSTTINYKGNHPINNPVVSSMLAGQYNCPITKSKQNIAAFARAEYRYIGKYYLDFLNSEYQSGYGLMNARVGITSKNYEIAFWGRNINDARYISWGYGSYILGSPRMYGVTLTGKF